jgi:hypothetical protein
VIGRPLGAEFRYLGNNTTIPLGTGDEPIWPLTRSVFTHLDFPRGFRLFRLERLCPGLARSVGLLELEEAGVEGRRVVQMAGDLRFGGKIKWCH